MFKEWYSKYILKGFFGWENQKWFLRNIQATFSNKESYFARKRIESFILFINATALLDMFCYKTWQKLDTPSMLAIYGAQMVYAGYQVIQIRKDLKMAGDANKSTEVKQEVTENSLKTTITEESKTNEAETN